MMTCGDCIHWHRQPIDPANVTAPRPGECRAQPPQVIVLPARGGVTMGVSYPVTPGEFPSCGCFRESGSANGEDDAS